MTAEEVRHRIETSWRELVELVDGMDEAALSAPGPDGWAIKDHLVHVGAWEHSLLALLEGRDREAAMGLDHTVEVSTDAINEAVWRLHRDESLQAAQSYFRAAHSALMAGLAGLNTADMERPYSHYQPQEADESRPVLGWIEGNTYDHYTEHIGWIKARQ
jgi:hypothetical protein